MLKISSFTPIPNTLIDDYLSKGKINPQEFVVLSVLMRKTYGWHKEREWIRNKELARLCNLSESTLRRTVTALSDEKSDKDFIEIIYTCPDCNETVKFDPTNYQCGKCGSKDTPAKAYELKIEEISNFSFSKDPEGNKQEKLPFEPNTPVKSDTPPVHTEQTPPVKSDTPPVHTEQTPCSHRTDPLFTQNRGRAFKPNNDVELQPPKETLLKETLKKEKEKSSSSNSYTKEDQAKVLENFKADEDEIFQNENEEKNQEIKAKRIIEKQYSEYFRSELSEQKRLWLAQIGKKPDSEIEDALLNVSASLQNPAKLIEFMHKRLYSAQPNNVIPIEEINDLDTLDRRLRGTGEADEMWKILKQISKVSQVMTLEEIYKAAFSEINSLDREKSVEWFVKYCNSDEGEIIENVKTERKLPPGFEELNSYTRPSPEALNKLMEVFG